MHFSCFNFFCFLQQSSPWNFYHQTFDLIINEEGLLEKKYIVRETSLDPVQAQSLNSLSPVPFSGLQDKCILC